MFVTELAHESAHHLALRDAFDIAFGKEVEYADGEFVVHRERYCRIVHHGDIFIFDGVEV